LSHHFRLTVWVAFADLFSVLALLAFGLYIGSRPPSEAAAKPAPPPKPAPKPKPAEPPPREHELLRIDREVKALAQAMRDALSQRGVDVPELGENVSIVLPELLLFDSGEYTIRDRSRAALVVDALRAVRARWRPNFVLVIQGHTDARPPRPNPRYRDNLELSRLRAGVVERYMTEAGIVPPLFQVVSQGLGATQPVVPNCRSNARTIECAGASDFRTGEELSANRRIELRFGVFSGNTR
jgi:flagellar motor protein MotB